MYSNSELETPLTEGLVLKPNLIPSVLLVDDDPTYGAICRRLADRLGVSLTFCKSVKEFGELGEYNFDVAIIDCDLGAVSGFELTTYIEHMIGSLPVILVSQSREFSTIPRPPMVKDFIPKALGPYAVFDAAFEAHEIRLINRKISRYRKRLS